MNNLLFQRFTFTKPLQIEYIESGDEVVALPEKIIVRGCNTSFAKDLAEILSRAKLGEKDYLLATFFFQKNIKKSDEKYAHMFVELCQPLQDAWTYKIMRQYAPDIYDEEIQELFRLYTLNAACCESLSVGGVDRRFVFSMYAVLAENPTNKVEFTIQAGSVDKVIWENYVSELTILAREEPDPELYLRLPSVVQAPYKVTIKSEPDGFRYFEVLGIS